MRLEGNTLLLVEDFFNDLLKEQELAIFEKNEQLANELWARIQNYNIVKNYVKAYSNLKEQKYFEAWRLLDRVDIDINFVSNNFNLSDLFMLTFLKEIVPKYMKLFPYKYFTSRESIVKSSECSICHRKFRLRNRCEHTIGKIYMGKLCVRIITEMSFVGVSIVENPVDRYTVLQSKEINYNYSILDKLMEMLSSPFQRFDIDEQMNGSDKHLNVTVGSIQLFELE